MTVDDGHVVSRGLAPAMVLGAVVLLATASISGQGIKLAAPVVIVIAMLAVWQRSLLRWHSLVGLVLIVVMFVPIGRYRLPGGLPFNLELYRVVVALVVIVWLASLLIDPNVRLRKTAFDWPLNLIGGCVLASELANPGRVNAYGDNVAKTLTFFLSFLLVYYVTATTLRGREPVMFLLRLLGLGGFAIGAAAIMERRFTFNVFDHVHSVLPFLEHQGIGAIVRGGNLRVFGPAQHPIALGAALIMILPIAIYFAKTSSRRWWIAAIVIVLGALASGSRTAITMLAAEVIVFIWLKPKETIRLWPVLVPAIVVIHAFLPGAIGGFKASFFPKGGLIAQQSTLGAKWDPTLSGGRIRQLRPMISEASNHPLFGEGFGTRFSGFNVPERNAPILDNQWLNNLLDVGYLGFFLWLWLFIRVVRRLTREARSAENEADEWLFASLAASMVAFPIGMLTFDAFGFTQIFFLFWIMLGLSAVLIRETGQRRVPAQPAPRTRQKADGRIAKQERRRRVSGGGTAERLPNKTVATEFGDVSVRVPPTRVGTFELATVPEHQRHAFGLSGNVISLYARGLTTSEIREQLAEIYGSDVLRRSVTKITDALVAEMQAWQTRPLDPVYAIVMIDRLAIKMRGSPDAHNSVHVAVGVNLDGERDVLGLWMCESPRSPTIQWARMLSELQARGIQDVLTVCCEALDDLPDAVRATWPSATVQADVNHTVRDGLRDASRKHWSDLNQQMRKIYAAPTVDAAEAAYDEFKLDWADLYPTLIDAWENSWQEFLLFLELPAELRQVVYATNAVESLDARFRRAVRHRGDFPTEQAALTVLYLVATERRKNRQNMNAKIYGWKPVSDTLHIHYGNRITRDLADQRDA